MRNVVLFQVQRSVSALVYPPSSQKVAPTTRPSSQISTSMFLSWETCIDKSQVCQTGARCAPSQSSKTNTARQTGFEMTKAASTRVNSWETLELYQTRLPDNQVESQRTRLNGFPEVVGYESASNSIGNTAVSSGSSPCATSNPSPCDGCGRKPVLARENSIGLGKISTESGYRNRFENPYIFDCSRV